MYTIYTHNPKSKGAKALSEALNFPLSHRRKLRPLDEALLIINWGATKVPRLNHQAIMNHPKVVNLTSNKATFFEGMQGVGPTPKYTFDMDEAKKWAKGGPIVVCRTKLRGHSGVGIVLARHPEEVVEARLYTKYIRKSEEYRVHVVGQKCIDIQRKARKLNVENPNWLIRCHKNGFIYAKEGANRHAELIVPIAIEAVKSFLLDFGAVDIVIEKNTGKPYILEINTAPGVEGHTIDLYANAFRKVIGE